MTLVDELKRRMKVARRLERSAHTRQQAAARDEAHWRGIRGALQTKIASLDRMIGIAEDIEGPQR